MRTCRCVGAAPAAPTGSPGLLAGERCCSAPLSSTGPARRSRRGRPRAAGCPGAALWIPVDGSGPPECRPGASAGAAAPDVGRPRGAPPGRKGAGSCRCRPRTTGALDHECRVIVGDQGVRPCAPRAAGPRRRCRTPRPPARRARSRRPRPGVRAPRRPGGQPRTHEAPSTRGSGGRGLGATQQAAPSAEDQPRADDRPMTAGPTTMMSSAGRMQTMSGKVTLTGTFIAASSAR